MIWFTHDGNYEEIKKGRFVLVVYDSLPRIQRVMTVLGARPIQLTPPKHPIIGTDLELTDDGWVSIPAGKNDAWTSTLAVMDTEGDAWWMKDHAEGIGGAYQRDLEEARLKFLASIRLACE